MAKSSKFTTVVARGVEAFEANSDPWDFLRSACRYAPPMSHSKNVVSSCRQLYSNGELIVVFVFDSSDEPVAALPLVRQSRRGIVTLELPNNQWGNWGELLVNPAFDSDDVYDAVVEGLNQVSHFGLRLNLINSDAPRWRRFLARLESTGPAVFDRHAFSVGMIEHDTTWDGFRSRLSKGLRKKLTKFKRLLERQGEVSFEVNRLIESNDVDRLLGRVFDIEKRSWKNAQSTSTADHRMEDFYREQARCLAEQGELCVSFLKLAGDDVAFEFGMVANRVYYSFKIGYAERFKSCSPGHLLAEHLTHQFHLNGECVLQDTVGPLSEATARWSSSAKKISNVTVSGNVVGAKSLLRLAFAIKGWLARGNSDAVPCKLGAGPVTGNAGDDVSVNQAVSGR